jgi:hypothetical protein
MKMLTPAPRKKEKTANAEMFLRAMFTFEVSIKTELKRLVINFLSVQLLKSA